MDKWCVNFLKTLISEVLADLKALSDLDTMAPGSSLVCHYRGNIVLTLMGKLLYLCTLSTQGLISVPCTWDCTLHMRRGYVNEKALAP